MKAFDLEPNEYRDMEAGVRERSDAIQNTKPIYPDPPPKPVLPKIKWVMPRIVDGVAVYDKSGSNKS